MTTAARSWVFAASLILIGGRAVSADELWVTPTLQQDLGGLGVGTGGVWPTTPTGAVRFAWAIPDNLRTFQSARVVLIPHTSVFGANVILFVCAAKSSDAVASACAGPLTQGFTSVADELLDVDVSALIAPRIGTTGRTYLSGSPSLPRQPPIASSVCGSSTRRRFPPVSPWLARIRSRGLKPRHPSSAAVWG